MDRGVEVEAVLSMLSRIGGCVGDIDQISDYAGKALVANRRNLEWGGVFRILPTSSVKLTGRGIGPDCTKWKGRVSEGAVCVVVRRMD